MEKSIIIKKENEKETITAIIIESRRRDRINYSTADIRDIECAGLVHNQKTSLDKIMDSIDDFMSTLEF